LIAGPDSLLLTVIRIDSNRTVTVSSGSEPEMIEGH
jgi:hypothetical protein